MRLYYFYSAGDTDRAVPFCTPGMVDAPADVIEDYVECFRCDARVPAELARSLDAGWICDDCMGDLS